MKRALVRTLGAAALAPVLLAGCTDRVMAPSEQEVATYNPIVRLTCSADLTTQVVDCEPLPEESDGAASPDGRVIGSQGVYVRLRSENVTYAEDLFSFDVFVQNLMNLKLGTADGATRHPAGVRVFFVQEPEATSGNGSISVANATGTGTFTATNQPYFQYGGTIEGVDGTELGGDGMLLSGETSFSLNWKFDVPPTVNTFNFLVLVAAETPPGTAETVAPQITAIDGTLVPGTTATISGNNFSGTPAANMVFIGDRMAQVTGGSAGKLEVTVPCHASGLVPVSVSTAGLHGADFYHNLQVAQRTVAVGELLILDGPGAAECNELAPSGGSARYVLSVFNTNTNPNANSPIQISGDGPGSSPSLSRSHANDGIATPTLAGIIEETAQQRANQIHERLLEQNRQILETYGGRLRDARPQVINRDGDDEMPATRTFRIPDINSPSICRNYYVVEANLVYHDGKFAIYEDAATSEQIRAAENPLMAQYYEQIGDQLNEDMEPIISTYFGDLLRRDAVLDNNGVVIALSTPRINNSFSGVAGFVASCDQFPNDDANSPEVGGPYTASAGSNFGSSNHGEMFYVYQPTSVTPGFNPGTVENWYRTVRSTFIHELKHAASHAARVANGAASFEVAWLEEGTARHAEEIWARTVVDDMPWKGNHGYGSAANPVGYYCDSRPSGWPECEANPRRPVLIIQRPFAALYTLMFGQNARLLSPFGATASDNASYYYAISWSLVRYAIDRYATDEASFYQALTQSNNTGVTNLTNAAGVDITTLLGGWSMALALDDSPYWSSSPSNDLQFRTWDFRNVYAGMNSDFSSTYTLAYPLVPTQKTFGNFTLSNATTLRGGGVLWYEVSGTHTNPQLIRLEVNGGGPPASTVKMAIVRVE